MLWHTATSYLQSQYPDFWTWPYVLLIKLFTQGAFIASLKIGMAKVLLKLVKCLNFTKTLTIHLHKRYNILTTRFKQWKPIYLSDSLNSSWHKSYQFLKGFAQCMMDKLLINQVSKEFSILIWGIVVYHSQWFLRIQATLNKLLWIYRLDSFGKMSHMAL